MSFSDKMEGIYNPTITTAIIKAGYSPYRVDKKEHNNKIDDEIMAQIKKK